MAGQVRVDFDGMTAAGASLAASGAPMLTPTAAAPPGLDSTSIAAAAHVMALAEALEAHFAFADAQREAAASTTAWTVQHFAGIDAANAAAMMAAANGTSAPMPGSSPPSPASVSLPAPPGMNTIKTPNPGPIEPAEAFSAAIHGGPGPESLRAVAALWHSRAAAESEKASNLDKAAAQLRASWTQGSGDNTAAEAVEAHARWSHQAVAEARSVANLAEHYAQAATTARQNTPPPQRFAQLRSDHAKAVAANAADPMRRYTGLVNSYSRAIVDNQNDANSAASGFRQAVISAVQQAGKLATAAPPIVKPGGSGDGPRSGADKGHQGGHRPGSPDEHGAGFGGGATDPAAPLDAANPADSSTLGSASEVAGQLLGSGMGALSSLGSMTGGGGGSPASALSSLPGLSSLSAPSMPSPGTGGGDQSPSGSGDPGAGDGLGSTTPAADFGGGSGGGGAGGGAGGGVSGGPLPAASVSASPVTGSVSTGGSAPGGAGGGGGMGMMPPMGGGRKGGDENERNKKLSPDKKMMLRPQANTEEVFGDVELAKKRRPKGDKV